MSSSEGVVVIGSGSISEDVDGEEDAELLILQIKECFVYTIPPRKSAASYRADEWDINKWAWEGSMRIVSQGDLCRIVLEDKSSKELFAQAVVRPDQPVPVEPVIDSSRFFVLRIEDTSAPPDDTKAHGARHAFVGLGFRERTTAYDFQEAVYDHVKYLNKKREAEAMDQEFLAKPLADLSLKAGQTIHLELRRPSRMDSRIDVPQLHRAANTLLPPPATPGSVPAPPIRQSSGDLAAHDLPDGLEATSAGDAKLPLPLLPPPPPPQSVVGAPAGQTPVPMIPSPSLEKDEPTAEGAEAAPRAAGGSGEEDFGDFQAA